MTRVIDVLMICFELTLFKKTLEEKDELNKDDDDDDADERKRNT